MDCLGYLLLIGVLRLSSAIQRNGLAYETVIYHDDNEVNDAGGLSKAEIAQCVTSVNAYRNRHRNTGPLKWDNYLASQAQAYAEKLLARSYRRGKAELIHEKPARGMGENLYWSDNQKAATCADADKSWYSEIKDYSYATGGSKTGYAVGHFTQMVWKDTTKIGVGIASGKSIRFAKYGNTQTFIVAKYQKPGNFYWIGKKLESYSANVQPLKGSPKKDTTLENDSKEVSLLIDNEEKVEDLPCSNKYDDVTCTRLLSDGMCTHFVFGARIRGYCRLTCDACK